MISLEEIRAYYKVMMFWKRAVFIALITIIPAAYDLISEGQVLSEEKEEAIGKKDAAEQKFKDAKTKKENLPKLEEKLADTEGEMARASKKLPDEFMMDQILQKTSIIAQEVGVDLRTFHPGKGKPSETAYKYVEQPIKLELVGTYGEIATFFDHLVHLELLVHIRNFEMSPYVDPTFGKNSALSSEQLQEAIRAETKILTSADMMIYRTLSKDEYESIQKTVLGPEKDKEKDKKKGKKSEKADMEEKKKSSE